MSYGVGCKHGSDPALLFWRRPVASAPIQPLAWEHLYATGVALEEAKRQRKKETNKQTRDELDKLRVFTYYMMKNMEGK